MREGWRDGGRVYAGVRSGRCEAGRGRVCRCEKWEM